MAGEKVPVVVSHRTGSVNTSRSPPLSGTLGGDGAADRLRAGERGREDLTAQRQVLAGLRVGADRVYVDHGLTGTNRDRPGLREALAACRAGTRWW